LLFVFKIFCTAACWKHLTPEDHHAIVALIHHFYEQRKESERSVSSKENVLQLVKYVKLNEIYKLRACYFASKKDQQVLCMLEDEVSGPTPATYVERDDEESVTGQDSGAKPKKQQKIDCFVATLPKCLLKAYCDNCHSKIAQNKLFYHLTNKAAQEEYNHKKHVTPSAALDIEMSEQQMTFLNPKFFDMLSGSIMYDCKSKGAMHLLAK